MLACRPLIICNQHILKHPEPIYRHKVKEIHIFEYLITKFHCFFGIIWHGDFVY